ncbi:hypothetical protein [Jeongeupia sp. HS-3]|uniref:hypothetical protein n=1 Tax=Jeongeupia sp. HS-3 TaxID=1009682 RepID=UPI00191029D6|nr:hypothetical protein [Jeongeupia sp. HS-3]
MNTVIRGLIVVVMTYGVSSGLYAAPLEVSGAEKNNADMLVLPARSEIVDLAPITGQIGVESLRVQSAANTATQTGSVVSALTDVTSGMNMIGAGALAGMNGIGTVIQNSGNSVSIQNATILNVSVQ